MSVFDKTVDDLETSDVEQLLADSAVENVRLEFKREIPNKNETLKKLSSFANTYGGYLIKVKDDGVFVKHAVRLVKEA